MQMSFAENLHVIKKVLDAGVKPSVAHLHALCAKLPPRFFHGKGEDV
jgi:hypothetical protein